MIRPEVSVLARVLGSLKSTYGSDTFEEALDLLEVRIVEKIPRTILEKIRSVMKVGEELTTYGVVDLLERNGHHLRTHSVSACLSGASLSKDGFKRVNRRWCRVR
jgi:hypothetical protein